MTVAAGSKSLALSYLKASLADCATFRTWVGAGGASVQAQALARIHVRALPPPDDGKEFTRLELRKFRPYALVWNEDYRRQKVATGTYDESGDFVIHLAQDVPEEVAGNLAEADLRLANTAGQIVDELLALSGGAGCLAIENAQAGDPGRSHPDDESGMGDAQWIDIMVTSGG